MRIFIHYVGNIINIAISSFLTLYISNQFGNSAYGEYSLYAALLSFSLVFGGLGINALLQNTMPRVDNYFSTMLISVSLIRFIVSTVFAVVLSYLYDLEFITLILYFSVSAISLMIHDNILIYEGRVSVAFYGKVSSNILKLLAITFISKDVISFIYNSIIIDFIVMTIAVSYSRKKVKVKLRGIVNKQLIKANFLRYKSVYLGNILSFFQSPSFLIMYFSMLSVNYEDLSQFSFVVNIGFFLFNAISLLSRTEAMFVSKALANRKYQVNKDLIKLSLVLLVSSNVVVFSYRNEVVKYIFNGSYLDTYYFINVVGIIAIINSFAYLLSPVIYMYRKFMVFSISSALALLFTLILPFYQYMYGVADLSIGVYMLLLMSIIKVVYIYVSCFRVSKEVTLECVFNIFYVPMIAIVSYLSCEIIMSLVIVDSLYSVFFSSGVSSVLSIFLCSFIIRINWGGLRNV
ncbi:hypothetical protein VTH8203_01469 [Vibrio thalassae]|uniref:Polysaccharide biosynthesis protein n=1 Tax=Vibrio thalassae TaxID=1243014 RepID=A0A240EGQ9_9VIBR|nr:hypothetical protein VTH8203_01469 [Vibrio thalassae]